MCARYVSLVVVSAVMLVMAPVLVTCFSGLPSSCSCQQLGTTQGLACQCESIAGSFPSGFPAEIAKITFTFCSFTSISNGAFNDLELLSEIHFANSRITQIESFAFSGLSGLRLITFFGQSWGDDAALISFIRPNAFDDLSFRPGTTNGLHNGILFENIKIGTIEANAFSNVRGLSQLLMRAGSINVVDDLAFDGVEDIVTFQIQNSNINQRVYMPFTSPVAFVNFIMRKLSTPVLGAFMIPSDASEVIVAESTFDTMECGIFADGVPAELDWEDNTVVCDCRLEWVFGDEDGDNALPDEVIDSFTCSGPASAVGNELSQYADIPLPCSGVEAVPSCGHYNHGGDGSVPVLAIVLPIIFIAILVLVVIVGFLMWKRSKTQKRKFNVITTVEPKSEKAPELPPRTHTRPESGMYDVIDDYSIEKYEYAPSSRTPSSRKSTPRYSSEPSGRVSFNSDLPKDQQYLAVVE